MVFSGQGKWHGTLFEINRKLWDDIRFKYDRLHNNSKTYKDYVVGACKPYGLDENWDKDDFLTIKWKW